MLGRADLLDDAPAHHHDPVAQGHGLDLVVRHVDGGGAQPALQGCDLGAHLDAEFGVEVGERLVHQEGLRVPDDGAAHGDALTLAAGEVGGLSVQVLREVEDAGGLLDLGVDDGLVRLGQPQSEAHVVADVHVWVEGVALEHHGDVTVLGRAVVDHPAVDPQGAFGDVLQSGDHVEGGGLAAAGGADQDDELAVGDGEVEVVDGESAVGVALGDAVEDDLGHVLPSWPARVGGLIP